MNGLYVTPADAFIEQLASMRDVVPVTYYLLHQGEIDPGECLLARVH